ncbi:alpha/beta fold hydrolase [Roseateles chitinivorans]|uniref:alpha/beta fold hydrolase n=1 Tax=Roseateles chitinivorans TaxID=2917965 RepID=UPI003D6719D6
MNKSNQSTSLRTLLRAKLSAALIAATLASGLMSAGAADAAGPPQISSDFSTAPNEYATVGTAQIAYRRIGNGSRTPILLLQHFTGTMDGWDPLIVDGLAQDRTVILMSGRGVGSSTGTPSDSVEGMTDDAIGLLDALGMKTVDVFGFSLGGFVAQDLGLRFPSRVRRVILAGTGPRGGQDMQESSPAVVNALAEAIKAGDYGNARPFLFFSPSSAGQAAAHRFMARLKQRTGEPDGAMNSGAVAAAQGKAIHAWGQRGSHADWIQRLKQFKPATLIVNGSDDIMVPTINSYMLAQAIPKAQLIVYPDAGHGSQFQYPGLFLEHARVFLDRDDDGLNDTR